MGLTERELRMYRRLCAFAGGIYLAWWALVEVLLPHAYNPLPGRLVVVVAFGAIVVASYPSAWVRRNIQVLWSAALWLLTAHYFWLFFENEGGIDWIVGAFITVTAVGLAMMSRASLVAYTVFTVALSAALLVELPALRESVFVPGVLTVLLQANVGLHARLGLLRDLAASNAHFQLLFDSTFEGVLIHDGRQVLQVNDALVRLLGGTRDELIGRDVLALVHADDHETARAGVFAGPSAPVELRMVRGDGSTVDVEARGKPFAHGRQPRRLVAIEDVTERKQRAAELRRINDALVRSNLELQRFAYTASHDLQTPLRSITSFVELLRSTYGASLDAQAGDWLARISGSAEHLQLLIRDLLDYSRVETESRPFEALPMREVFDKARGLLDATVRDAGAEITVDELPAVTGDRSQLVQLWLNLLGNAVKYRGAEPPRVHVTAEDHGEAWRFAVRDNGIGIAARHQQQIFEIFKRLHDQKQYPGTGIGLAICRRVVDRHGGKIWVESETGRGSVFYFTIPKLAERGP